VTTAPAQPLAVSRIKKWTKLSIENRAAMSV
jgi:hypothetical protein